MKTSKKSLQQDNEMTMQKKSELAKHKNERMKQKTELS